MRKGLEYREAESVASARKSRCSLLVACVRVPETRSVRAGKSGSVFFFFRDGSCDVLPRSDVKQENKLLSTSNLYGVCKYSSANPIEPDHLPPLPPPPPICNTGLQKSKETISIRSSRKSIDSRCRAFLKFETNRTRDYALVRTRA